MSPSRLLSVLAASATIVAFPHFAIAAPAITVQAMPGVADVGTVINVSVYAQDLIDLSAYQFDLNYDAARYTFVSGATEGAFLPAVGSTFFNAGTQSDGVVESVFATLIGPGPGASGSGLLASFTFSAASAGVGTFGLSNGTALDSLGADQTFTLGPAVTVAVVPEPGSWMLISVGALLMIGVHRRKFSARPSV